MHAMSGLTARSQTTIPREVREKLSLGPGVIIVYEIAGEEVPLRKGLPIECLLPARFADDLE